MTSHRPPPVQPGDPLTDREIQVLAAAATGLGNKGSARRLHLTENTIKTHMRRLFAKLDAADRSAAVAQGFAAGYLWIDVTGQVRAGQPATYRLVAAA